MALTQDQILQAKTFHIDGAMHPKGYCYEFRRNGRTTTWKTRPNEYRIPYKYGMYEYGYITHSLPAHVPGECPLRSIKEG
jgi:hypothetical protein